MPGASPLPLDTPATAISWGGLPAGRCPGAARVGRPARRRSSSPRVEPHAGRRPQRPLLSGRSSDPPLRRAGPGRCGRLLPFSERCGRGGAGAGGGEEACWHLRGAAGPGASVSTLLSEATARVGTAQPLPGQTAPSLRCWPRAGMVPDRPLAPGSRLSAPVPCGKLSWQDRWRWCPRVRVAQGACDTLFT